MRTDIERLILQSRIKSPKTLHEELRLGNRNIGPLQMKFVGWRANENPRTAYAVVVISSMIMRPNLELTGHQFANTVRRLLKEPGQVRSSFQYSYSSYGNWRFYGPEFNVTPDLVRLDLGNELIFPIRAITHAWLIMKLSQMLTDDDLIQG